MHFPQHCLAEAFKVGFADASGMIPSCCFRGSSFVRQDIFARLLFPEVLRQDFVLLLKKPKHVPLCVSVHNLAAVSCPAVVPVLL